MLWRRFKKGLRLRALSHCSSNTTSSRRNIAIPFGKQKLQWLGYQIVKKFRRYLYSFWRNSRTWRTEGQTDTGWRHIPRLCIAWRGKNWDENWHVNKNILHISYKIKVTKMLQLLQTPLGPPAGALPLDPIEGLPSLRPPTCSPQFNLLDPPLCQQLWILLAVMIY